MKTQNSKLINSFFAVFCLTASVSHAMEGEVLTSLQKVEAAAKIAFPEVISIEEIRVLRAEGTIEHNGFTLYALLPREIPEISDNQAWVREKLIWRVAGAQKQGAPHLSGQTYVYTPATGGALLFGAKPFEFMVRFDENCVLYPNMCKTKSPPKQAVVKKSPSAPILFEPKTVPFAACEVVKLVSPLDLVATSTPAVTSWTASLRQSVAPLSLLRGAVNNFAYEADHVWTLIFTGSEGAKDLVLAIATLNPLTACLGIIKLGVAYKSFERTKQALWQDSAFTHLKELERNTQQMQELSGIMADNLALVASSLSGAKLSLADIQEKQTQISQILSKAQDEQRAQLETARELFDYAFKASVQADEAYARFKAANSDFTQGWDTLLALFGQLKNPFKQPLDEKADMKAQFIARASMMAEQIQPIEALATTLEERMKNLVDHVAEVNSARALYNKYFFEASNILLATVKSGMAKMKDAQDEVAALKGLSEQLQTTICLTQGKIGELQEEVEELKTLAAKNREEITAAEARVASMFETFDVAAGCAFAYGLASIAAGLGVGPIALSGFLTAYMAKSIRNSCLRSCSAGDLGNLEQDAPELHYWFSRILCKTGLVKAEKLQQLGRLLGKTYKERCKAPLSAEDFVIVFDLDDAKDAKE